MPHTPGLKLLCAGSSVQEGLESGLGPLVLPGSAQGHPGLDQGALGGLPQLCHLQASSTRSTGKGTLDLPAACARLATEAAS